MEVTDPVIQEESDPRPTPLSHHGTESHKQRLDLSPWDITADRIGENRLQRGPMPTGKMLSQR